MRYLREHVGESLLQLPFRLNTCVLHVFEVLAHVFHLGLELTHIFILPPFVFNHFNYL